MGSLKYVKQSDWIELGKELIGRYPLCQYCKKENANHLAHALFHKRYVNNAKAAKKFAVRYNAMPCCEGCQKFSETKEGRQHAWKVLCKREGHDKMREWYDSIDMVIKEEFK